MITDSISFKAKYLNKSDVFKRNIFNTYNAKPATFVEINVSNEHDYEAVKKAVSSWRDDTYGASIVHTIRYLKENCPANDCYKVYALTAQKSDFEILNPDKILGLAEMNLENSEIPHLSHIQVNPEYSVSVFHFEPNKYKHIGSAMLSSLKKIYSSILLKATTKNLGCFYKRNGFKCISENNRMYLWKCNKL